MLRLVYSKKNITNRLARDFLESKKNKQILNLKKYIYEKKIYIPGSGLMFISFSHSTKQINYIIKQIKSGSLKYFKK